MITDAFVSQKRVNVCEHMVKTAPHNRFRRVPPKWVQNRKEGGVEGMEGKLNGNYLRLIPGLCLENRTN
jgi:hypothetical protein